jgi:hypothetical protein
MVMAAATAAAQQPATDYVKLSAELLQTARRNNGALDSTQVRALAKATVADLQKNLQADNARKAFAINLYNAFSLAYLEADAIADADKREKQTARKRFVLAGEAFSLDDLLHNVLRRGGAFGKLKLGKTSAVVKALRPDRPDPRIHFGVSYGAASSPPIRTYQTALVESQLNLNAGAYLKQNVRYYGKTGEAVLPRLFEWYAADFGGEEGTRLFLKGYGVIPAHANPRIRFGEWDWKPNTANYAD